ncbi:hypothetical protein BDN70DRAFT_882984 [Pholiota conissans]|uniref:Secreted protein n=1 Tax=Pholiota conissans TaxID=109636 RepID=A0A9P6CX84_9AGAR|nr:hypothetical protein BDN70DRAFT_882984 [Pholiota conissans]
MSLSVLYLSPLLSFSVLGSTLQYRSPNPSYRPHIPYYWYTCPFQAVKIVSVFLAFLCVYGAEVLPPFVSLLPPPLL